jgi:hypothetical protein
MNTIALAYALCFAAGVAGVVVLVLHGHGVYAGVLLALTIGLRWLH